MDESTLFVAIMWPMSYKPREDVRNVCRVLILGESQSDPFGPGCES
jgi:hypothetical protein